VGELDKLEGDVRQIGHRPSLAHWIALAAAWRRRSWTCYSYFGSIRNIMPSGNLVPLRAGPWLMAQSWHDLLFAHWPVPIAQLRDIVPTPLTVDTFGGQAWLGVVAFRLSDVHLRGLPNAPGASHFPEVNLRTYVSLDGQPGVLFLSLHCPNRLAIALARPWFRLPYHYARVALDCRAGAFDFGSDSPAGAAFGAAYRPLGRARASEPGSLAAFLTERYCYYTVAADGSVYRCDIQHPPWQLAPAMTQVRCNTLAETFGLELGQSQPPVAHFTPGTDAVIWPLRRVGQADPE
jgi:uncharacterized protein YqjF (DUF2071 family)